MIEIWWKIDFSNLLDIGIDYFQKEEFYEEILSPHKYSNYN